MQPTSRIIAVVMDTSRTPTRSLAWLIATASVLLLAACASTPPTTAPDPLDVETAFGVRAANADALEGSLIGIVVRPFVGIDTLATEDYGPFRNAIAEATLAADGSIEGRFIAPRLVPRINDGFMGKLADRSYGGGYELFLVFFPPADCEVTATNPDEAALAQIMDILVWDGETVDDDGIPVITGTFALGESEASFEGGVWTNTFEAIVPVASRAAWSASTDGPCTSVRIDEGDTYTTTIDADLELSVGWQFLHTRYEAVGDATSFTETLFARTISADEADDLSALWTVREGMPASLDALHDPVVARLFR